jgi:ATP-dependent DNA helicase RecQ
MTEAARPILRGEESITLRKDTIKSARSGPKVREMVSEEDAPLLSALKAKRRALAEAASLPAYIIFTDRTLIEMAERKPANLDEMARIGGVGAKKLESYGREFLAVITGAVEEIHPARRKLATRGAGSLYDRLMATQAELLRGPEGHDKPMSCSAKELARVAAARPRDMADMERLLGPRHAERFGAAFLQVFEESSEES